MKVYLVVLVIFIGVFSFYAGSSKGFAPDKLKKLGVSDDNISKILDLKIKLEREKKEAKAELDIIKGRVEKELLLTDVDLQKVESILKESIEWRLKLQMAEITFRVEVKKIIGEDNWDKLMMEMKRDKKHYKRMNFKERGSQFDNLKQDQEKMYRL